MSHVFEPMDLCGHDRSDARMLLAFCTMRLRQVNRRFGLYLIGLLPMALLFDARWTAFGLVLISSFEVLERLLVTALFNRRAVFLSGPARRRLIWMFSILSTLPVLSTVPTLWILGAPDFNTVCCGMLALSVVYATLHSGEMRELRVIRVSIYFVATLALCAWDFWSNREALELYHFTQPFGAIIFAGGLFLLGHELDEILAARRRSLVLTRRMRDEARRTSAQKSRFLAVMSHEIRTPLHGMLGVAQLLARTPLQADQERKLGILIESGAALATLLDDAMDLARAEEGVIAIRPTPADPVALCREVAEAFEAAAAAKGGTIRVVVSGPVPDRVLIDPRRVRQCITNLVSNAVKYAEGHPITISIDQEKRLDAPGDWILIAVEDEGRGIPEREVAGLFEPYAQLDRVLTAPASGSGLGLAITRQLMTRMGGDVRYEALSGRGARFVLRLPLVPVRPVAHPGAPLEVAIR